MPATPLRLCVLSLALVLATAVPAFGAAGDVFEEGARYCASTHENHGTLPGYGPALDLNGETDDHRWPVHAPGDGRVRVYSRGGPWGNSVVWTSANGMESLHLAHLDSFGRIGGVDAGDRIGRIGSTGEASGSHLHVSAQQEGEPSEVVLHGEVIEVGDCYVSPGPIAPSCGGRPATLLGSGDGDVLRGTRGDDVIVGLGGADRIIGRGGDDVLCGNRGADRLRAGVGEDLLEEGPGGGDLRGGADQDALDGGDGDDVARGGDGADELDGDDGRDVLAGNEGPDRLLGGSDADRLSGGPGGDRYAGGTGHDMAVFASATQGVVVSLVEGAAAGEGADTLTAVEALAGSSFADALAGDGRPNRLFGARGDDALDGGAGEDTLDGGTGIDTCTNGETMNACEA